MFQQILSPIRMSTTPPNNSARDLYFAPNTLPTLTPMHDRINVVAPMKLTAGTIRTCRKANVTPTARASMLVATASGSIVPNEKESLRFSSSVSRDSRIMLPPISASSTKAIQWSTLVISDWNRTPSKYPTSGIII